MPYGPTIPRRSPMLRARRSVGGNCQTASSTFIGLWRTDVWASLH